MQLGRLSQAIFQNKRIRTSNEEGENKYAVGYVHINKE
jgi:hypothetical protein